MSYVSSLFGILYKDIYLFLFLLKDGYRRLSKRLNQGIIRRLCDADERHGPKPGVTPKSSLELTTARCAVVHRRTFAGSFQSMWLFSLADESANG